MIRASALTILISVFLAACGADAGPDLGGQQAQLEQQLTGVKRAQTATAAAMGRAATAEAKATRQHEYGDDFHRSQGRRAIEAYTQGFDAAVQHQRASSNATRPATAG